MPEGGEVGRRQRVIAAFVQRRPGNAKLGCPVGDDLDNDGFDQDLGPPDIQLVDDGHGRAHHLRRGRQNQCVGLRICPDAYVCLASSSAAWGRTGGACCRRSLLLGEVLLQFRRKFLGVCVTKVTNLRVAAVFERRIEMRDQGSESQTLRAFAADQYAVRSRIGHQLYLHRRAVGPRRLRQRSEYANDFGGRRVRQRNYLDIVVIRLVDPAND